MEAIELSWACWVAERKLPTVSVFQPVVGEAERRGAQTESRPSSEHIHQM